MLAAAARGAAARAEEVKGAAASAREVGEGAREDPVEGETRGAREAAKEEVGAKAGPAGGDLAADNKMKIPVG